MLAAALGLGRDADLSALNALKFGVRADREGEDITDFHMASAFGQFFLYCSLYTLQYL